MPKLLNTDRDILSLAARYPGRAVLPAPPDLAEYCDRLFLWGLLAADEEGRVRITPLGEAVLADAGDQVEALEAAAPEDDLEPWREVLQGWPRLERLSEPLERGGRTGPSGRDVKRGDRQWMRKAPS